MVVQNTKWLRALIAAVVLVLTWQKQSHKPPEYEFAVTQHAKKRGEVVQYPMAQDSIYQERVVSGAQAPHVHCATLFETSEGGLSAFWYGGSREGGKDVVIYSASLPPGATQWGQATVVQDRAQVQRQLKRYIKKLGNPVAFRDQTGTLWLYFVSVSVGGWAGSAVNVMRSQDDGQTWEPARRLVTSPFFNVSTLVKGAAVPYANQAIGLPVYHEFMGKFGELLYIDAQGRIRDKKRLSWGRESLQPVLIPLSEDKAQVYMRFAGHEPNKTLYTETQDGGVSWKTPVKIDLPNPNSAVAGLRHSSGRLLLVFNNSSNHRNRLSLAASDDEGKHWRILHEFERRDVASKQHHYSYPFMIEDARGHVHVLYSYNRDYIKHVEFNPVWLRQVAGD